MKNVFVMCVALTAALGAAGCKKKKSSDGNAALAKMSEFTDKMCACKDIDCVTKITEEMAKSGEEEAKKAGDKKAAAMSEAESKKHAELNAKFTECAQKAMAPAAAAGDTAAPPAGSGAPAAGSAAPAAAAPAAAEPAGAVVDPKDMKIRQPEQNSSVSAGAGLESEQNGQEITLGIQDVRNRPYMIKEFETPPEGATLDKVGEYPALVKKEDYGPELSVLVNKEGLVVQATTSRGAPTKDVETLKKVVLLFDLAGLEKADMKKKPQLDGKTLAKYFPKLPVAK